MIFEFEGRTEKEAIEKATLELGIERDNFDVEILEIQRGGLFKKGYVKIRLHTEADVQLPEKSKARAALSYEKTTESPLPGMEPDSDIEKNTMIFITTILEKMEIEGSVTLVKQSRREMVLNIDTQDSALIIGRKGRTLDALQLLANFYTKKMKHYDHRVIIDCERYRLHREEILVRIAYTAASKVRSSRRSVLLEPMNSFDRRLIHSVIADIKDLSTKSEGEGSYRQVRISYVDSPQDGGAQDDDDTAR